MVANGDVYRCTNGSIVKIEAQARRPFIGDEAYQYEGSPKFTEIDCKTIDYLPFGPNIERPPLPANGTTIRCNNSKDTRYGAIYRVDGAKKLPYTAAGYKAAGAPTATQYTDCRIFAALPDGPAIDDTTPQICRTVYDGVKVGYDSKILPISKALPSLVAPTLDAVNKMTPAQLNDAVTSIATKLATAMNHKAQIAAAVVEIDSWMAKIDVAAKCQIPMPVEAKALLDWRKTQIPTLITSLDTTIAALKAIQPQVSTKLGLAAAAGDEQKAIDTAKEALWQKFTPLRRWTHSSTLKGVYNYHLTGNEPPATDKGNWKLADRTTDRLLGYSVLSGAVDSLATMNPKPDATMNTSWWNGDARAGVVYKNNEWSDAAYKSAGAGDISRGRDIPIWTPSDARQSVTFQLKYKWQNVDRVFPYVVPLIHVFRWVSTAPVRSVLTRAWGKEAGLAPTEAGQYVGVFAYLISPTNSDAKKFRPADFANGETYYRGVRDQPFAGAAVFHKIDRRPLNGAAARRPADAEIRPPPFLTNDD